MNDLERAAEIADDIVAANLREISVMMPKEAGEFTFAHCREQLAREIAKRIRALDENTAPAAISWRPIGELPEELRGLPAPRLGQHVCKVETAGNGEVWVIEFHPTAQKPLRCFRLPHAIRGN